MREYSAVCIVRQTKVKFHGADDNIGVVIQEKEANRAILNTFHEANKLIDAGLQVDE